MTTALTTRVSTNATFAPAVKGSPISSAEIDNNFISLATNKLEIANNLADLQDRPTAATNLSVGTSSQAQFGSLGVGTTGSATTGEIRATNQITSYYSDARLKTNIKPIPNALEKVMQITGVTYTGNKLAESFGFDPNQKQVGVLSHEIEAVLPEAVKSAPFDIMLFEHTEMSKSGQNFKTVQYEKLVPLLIEAIKELNIEVKKLKEIK